MAKTEREYVETARDALRKAEAEWGKAIAAVIGIANVNEDPALANTAFGVAADLTMQKAEMMTTHFEATKTLLASWPEYGDVVTRGPGGGRG